MGHDSDGRDGQAEGLGSLDDRRGRLVRLAYRFVWNRFDAEDAVQNALALVHQRRSQLRDPTKLWSWACRIVVRQCLLLRRADARRTRVQREAIDDKRGWVDSQDPVESNERAAIVRWAIEQLSPQQRTAITLRHLEEMSYERIADIMEISRSTARVHVKAAREAMRATILNRRPEYFGAEAASESDRS